MTLCGVDIYVWSEEVPTLPKQYENFTLNLVADRGTKVYPPPAPEVALSEWHQCRYISKQTVSNQDIDALVRLLSDQGLTWTKCQKLYKDGDINLFSEPY